MTDFASISLFRNAAPSSVRLLTEDMVRFFRTGDIIISEDTDGGELLILLEGEANIHSKGTFLVCRKAGDVVGEQAILEGTVRSATVIAQGMVRTLLIPPHVVAKLMADAAFVANLARIVSQKLRAATSTRAVRYRNEERLFGEFSAHVSPELASRLLAEGISYGEPRFQDVCLLMTDIRSFTETCEHMTPSEIGSQLSSYLDRMVEILYRHGAFVDKFIGDAILAVWGLTPHDGNLAPRALACAEEMLAASSAISFGGQPIRIGVGLNAGRVFAGNVGSNRKRQFTVLGAPVNLVARLESETKQLATGIIVGSDFYVALTPEKRALFEKHSDRQIKGFGRQTIYGWSPQPVEASPVFSSRKEESR
jgi:class 3 adenylate cyclase